MPKAYVFTRYGGPETEAPVDPDHPRPGPGEVRAAMRGAGADLMGEALCAVGSGRPRGKAARKIGADA
ncbi:hypothetical protein [Streptomyces sp. NBC_00637]|uniref:hypothetical protein n=1 Tax=Streptomyces sp. NBC_00637 TaxID=2903667 RepID=UPI0038678B01